MPKAILLPAPGADLVIGEIDIPQPEAGEILVDVRAGGLNPVDYKLNAKGRPAWQWPHVIGVDGTGTVSALGPGVGGWKVGDRVAFHVSMDGPGVFAAQARVPARSAFAVPNGLSWQQAAALPCAGLTAYLACERKFPRPLADDVALVHAGAGGVGGFCVQLLKRQGLRVITTCSSTSDGHVRSLGADEIIHYADQDITARLLELTDGRGADRIVSPVDRATATADLERLAYGGHLACVVGLADLSQLTPFSRSASIHEIALGAAHLSGSRRGQEDLRRMGTDLTALVLGGEIDAMVSEVVAFDDIPAALQRLAGRHVHGKIVAEVG